MPEKALQIAVKRREVEGKGEKERNNPFECRVPKNRKERFFKKAFFSDQCEEIEETYSMGNTRNLFKKI